MGRQSPFEPANHSHRTLARARASGRLASRRPGPGPDDLDDYEQSAAACATIYHYLNTSFNEFRDQEMGGSTMV